MTPIGYVDSITRFCVQGWAANTDDWSSTLKLAILVNGSEVASVEADQFRPGLEQLGEGATGHYAFRHYFDAPLSCFRANEVTVRVVGHGSLLPSNFGSVLEPIMGTTQNERFRPQAPILLTTMGRSGSTALMAILSQHPHVVVAGRRPFEVEMGCYYAYALRTLTAAGDQVRSLRSDKITATENRFHIGFNPYFEPAIGGYLRNPTLLPQLINRKVSPRIAEAFHDIILDFYEMISQDQEKAFPLYFAEKSLPEANARLGIRLIFGNCKELVVVRDLRDALCSFMSYGQLDFQSAINALLSSTHRFIEIIGQLDPSIHIIRYEDFVDRQDETMAGVARFLGISDFPASQDRLGQLFGEHATTSSPSQSIGRWKRDLSPEQLKACEILNPLLLRLGYEP